MTQTAPPTEKKLLDQYRDAINLKHYSPRTGDTYILWTREYILFHNKRHPREMGAPEINQFLTHLASVKKVSASTHTALAVGARGTRLSVPSSFSIGTFFTSDWTRQACLNFDPSAQKPCRRFSQRRKLNV
jgi:hypothetical protein